MGAQAPAFPLMVLVDTSVWIQHFRRTQPLLVELLEQGEVACHAMILGELACGHLADRRQVLRDLAVLPLAGACEDSEVMHLIDHRRLYGTGIGWVDAHLLASVLTHELRFWTLDTAFAKQAARLGVERWG